MTQDVKPHLSPTQIDMYTRCGEQYFDAPVYKRLEEITRQRDHLQKTSCFPLATYDMTLHHRACAHFLPQSASEETEG